MKFLLIVLIIRFLMERVINKKNVPKKNDAAIMEKQIRHPAEFELR